MPEETDSLYRELEKISDRYTELSDKLLQEIQTLLPPEGGKVSISDPDEADTEMQMHIDHGADDTEIIISDGVHEDNRMKIYHLRGRWYRTSVKENDDFKTAMQSYELLRTAYADALVAFRAKTQGILGLARAVKGKAGNQPHAPEKPQEPAKRLVTEDELQELIQMIENMN